MWRCLLVIPAVALLAACVAIPFKPDEIKPNTNVYVFLDNDTLKNKVALGTVSLAPDMPQYGQVLTANGFQQALQQSLQEIGWLSPSPDAPYVLDARFKGYETPFYLFNTKIMSLADYTLTNRKTGQVLYNQTVKISCVKTMGEVPDEDQRVVTTTKCAISENITHALRDINNTF